MKNKLSIWRLGQILFCGIALAFLLHLLLTQAPAFLASWSHLSLVTLFLASLCFSVYFYARALSWKAITQTLGFPLPHTTAIKIWFLGEVARYMPLNIWSFASRYQLCKSAKVPRKIILTSLLLEIVTLLLTTGTLAVWFITQRNHLGAFVLVGVILTGIILLLVRLPLRQLLHIFGWQIVAWSAFAVGTLSLVSTQAISGQALSAVVCAWLLGYLSFLTPMGLGVREGALTLFLTLLYGTGPAVFIALTSRALLTFTEAGHVVFWALYHQRALRARIGAHLLEHWDLYLVGSMMVIYAATFSYLTIQRHLAFASGMDLGNMDQTVWNTLHGRFFQLTGTTGTVSRFSIHADLILVLLTPLYAIWEKARMLLVAGSVILALGAIPTYLLARTILKNKWLSLAMVALYFLDTGMQWANMYDFHGVTLAIPLLLAAFYTARQKHWPWFYLLMTLALLTKEEISLFVAMIGLTLIFVWHEKVHGWLVFSLGCAWFILMSFVVIPNFSAAHTHWALQWYSYSESEVVSHPSIFVHIFNKFFLANDAFPYYFSLLKSVGGLAILGVPWLILALPELSINMLSTHPQMRSITLHYDSGIIPGLIIASIYGVYFLHLGLRRFPSLQPYRQKIVTGVVLITLLIAGRSAYLYGPLPLSPNCWCVVYQPDNDDRNFHDILANIPAEASVTASPELRPHITHRENAFTVPDATTSAEYIALIDQNRIVGNYDPKVFELLLIAQLAASPDYHLETHFGHFYLYKKNE